MMLKDYMSSDDGQELRLLLQDAFDGYCDFESSSYGELEIAASFQGSVYALLQPEEIKQFLCHTGTGYVTNKLVTDPVPLVEPVWGCCFDESTQ